jgi:hypothetical protein
MLTVLTQTPAHKRNQIEEAIARVFAPNCEEPPSELRTRMKRLLDLDRSIGRAGQHRSDQSPAVSGRRAEWDSDRLHERHYLVRRGLPRTLAQRTRKTPLTGSSRLVGQRG